MLAIVFTAHNPLYYHDDTFHREAAIKSMPASPLKNRRSCSYKHSWTRSWALHREMQYLQQEMSKRWEGQTTWTWPLGNDLARVTNATKCRKSNVFWIKTRSWGKYYNWDCFVTIFTIHGTTGRRRLLEHHDCWKDLQGTYMIKSRLKPRVSSLSFGALSLYCSKLLLSLSAG